MLKRIDVLLCDHAKHVDVSVTQTLQSILHMVGSNYVVVEVLSNLVALALNIRLRLVYATHV